MTAQPDSTTSVSLPSAPKVYYRGVFRLTLLTPTMLLDAGWTVVDGVWIAPPDLLRLSLDETQE